MKCCVEYKQIMCKQEEIMETLVTAFDEIHQNLSIALQDLSRDHPAAAAARIGRCMQILEISRDDAADMLDDEDDEDDSD